MNNPSKAERKDAWFSATADRRHGSAMYRAANGSLVAVTEVVPPGHRPASLWKDLMMIGAVYECVKLAPDYDYWDA